MNDTLTDRPSHGAAPPPPPARPPLRRPTDDRVIAGVASGIARSLAVDPVLVRIGFVVAIFAGGIGLPLYVAGWLLIPEEGRDDTAVLDLARSRGAQFWIGVSLLVIGVLALLDEARIFTGVTGDLAWPLVLIGIGVVLWRSSQRDDHRRDPGSDPVRTPTSPASAGATTAPSEGTVASAGEGENDAPPPPAPPAPSTAGSTPPGVTPQRHRSVLGRITLAVTLIAVGGMWLGDQLDLVQVTAGDVLAVALAIVGLGLLVGAFVGRARWLIIPGLLLIPIVTVSSSLDGLGLELGSGMGERSHTPGLVSELPDAYELSAGEIVLDLTELEFGDEPVEVAARIGAGSLRVIVPDDAGLEVDARSGVGEIRLLGEGPDGIGLDQEFARTGDRGPIVLDLEVGFGEIVVESRPASRPGEGGQ